MNKTFKRGFIFLLIMTLIVMGGPAEAFASVAADNNQNVIIGADSDVEEYDVNLSNHLITVTVPYKYVGKVNASYINLYWDSNVTATDMNWVSSNYNTLNVGDTATGTAFYKVGNNVNQYSADYSIKVVRAAKKNSVAQGQINVDVEVGTANTVNGELIKEKYSKNDGELLDHIIIKNKNGVTNDGSFTVNGGAYSCGNIISYGNMDSISYTVSTSGKKEYVIEYYESGNEASVGSVSLEIQAENKVLEGINTENVAINHTIDFPINGINSLFKAAAGKTSDFSKIVFTSLPSNTLGVLYKGYTSSSNPGSVINKNEEYLMSDFLNNIKFVAAKSAGKAIYKYTAYDENGNGYDGQVTIPVVFSSLNSISKTVSVDKNYYPSTDIKNAVYDLTGKNLDYVVFTTLPSSSKGSLYYGSSEVTTSNEYYYSGSSTKKYLSSVYFNAENEGSTSIKYKAYDTSGECCEGTINVTVAGEYDELDTISYTVEKDDAVEFKIADFTSVINEESDYALKYIKITGLPSSSKGTLYYDYNSSKDKGEEVEENDKFYKSGSSNDLIKDLTFVSEDITGTAYIDYIAYDTDMDPYYGRIKIIISNNADSDGNLDVISYTSKNGSVVDFNVSDFKNVLEEVSDEPLDYVKFDISLNSLGTLYYDYSENYGINTKVTKSSKYYRTGSSNKLLKYVSYVPSTGYSGYVYVKYTAYDEEGDSFDGKIKISVTNDNASKTINSLTYNVAKGKNLILSAADINNKFKAVANNTLSYITFSIPSSAYGTVYNYYINDSDKGTAIIAGEKYYYTGTADNLIDNLTFVPNAAFVGAATIKYYAYGTDSSDNILYEGTININVNDNDNDGVIAEKDSSKYFSDVDKGYLWAANQIDYLYEKGIVKGTSSVNNEYKYSPASEIKRGDFILMLYRAFNLNATIRDMFTDVEASSYYYDAIGVAKSLGIAKGTDGKFKPEESLTREDAMVFIYRTLIVTGKDKLEGSSDINKFTDRNNVSLYAVSSVGTLVKAGIISGYTDGTFAPKNRLSRAEMAVVLYKALIL